MSNNNGNNSEWKCPDCLNPLEGAIIVATGEENGLSGIFLNETEDRNWIQCDKCNRIVCKACCLNPASGYCNRCLIPASQTAKSPSAVLIFFCVRANSPLVKPQASETKTNQK